MGGEIWETVMVTYHHGFHFTVPCLSSQTPCLLMPVLLYALCLTAARHLLLVPFAVHDVHLYKSSKYDSSDYRRERTANDASLLMQLQYYGVSSDP